MRRYIRNILFILLILFFVSIMVYQGFRYYHVPKYGGNIELVGIRDTVEVLYDTYGIPHIYANNMQDAYQALGYAHAQDRLFQLEMMRRVGTGTLAELLGEDLIEVDKFFRTLGIPKHAKWSADEFAKSTNADLKTATEAYMLGINQFIENGNLPVEYTLLGHTPRNYTLEDMHGILGYMSFTFGMAIKTDPLVTKIARQLGPDYLNVLSVHMLPEHHFIQNHYPKRLEETGNIDLNKSVSAMLEKLPVPLLEGSNSWVIGSELSASGQVLFSNDTHIGFAQPAVWYEAHIEYPDFSFYGYHLAGIPFGLVGHTRKHSFGLTMFENDDQDFFEEKLNPDNHKQILYNNTFKDLITRIEKIKIKGGEEVDFEVVESIHGPIVNEVIPEIARLTENPVASWWVYVMEPSRALEAVWGLGHAADITEVEAAARLIHAPGLNVMYGDKKGNIAWWAAAKLPIRPEHVNSKLFLDGCTTEDESLGWYPFEENPMSINPPSGFVASANNQPDTLSNGVLYPGYYVHGERYNRIAMAISSEKDWDVAKMKKLQLEAVNSVHASTVKEMLYVVDLSLFDSYQPALTAVQNWEGTHGLKEIAPTVYYKWMYHTLHGMMADELGEEDFKNFLSTFLYIRSVPQLIRTETSPWWNNISTPENEDRKEILEEALRKTLAELSDQWGQNSENWHWENCIVLEHPHPLGAQKPLDRILNVKAPPVAANQEALNKMDFKLNGEGIYHVTSGPAMRIVIDFDNIENSESILPTGQSGNLFSRWYSDQADMYATGEYRPMLLNEKVIRTVFKTKLVITGSK